MDVFLMIRRKKTTMFLDAKENTKVSELKKMIEGITKQPCNEQRLFNDENIVMEDDKTLADYNLTSSTAKAQSPAEVGLAFMVDGTFEELEKTKYSSPPELPDVMKPGQEGNAHESVTNMFGGHNFGLAKSLNKVPSRDKRARLSNLMVDPRATK